jgi:hypothetical protein
LHGPTIPTRFDPRQPRVCAVSPLHILQRIYSTILRLHFNCVRQYHYDIPVATIQIMSVIPALSDIHLLMTGTERRRLRYSIPGFRLPGERRGIEIPRPHLQNFFGAHSWARPQVSTEYCVRLVPASINRVLQY